MSHPSLSPIMLPASCALCPRACGANRAAGQTGLCGAGDTHPKEAVHVYLTGQL